jgi:hypothetical protein
MGSMVMLPFFKSATTKMAGDKGRRFWIEFNLKD